MGNCGVGFAPAAPDRHEWLIELMEGVEDIPGSAMTEGITWEWTTLPRVPRRGGAHAPGARRRRPDRPRAAAGLRHGRARRRQRARHRRRTATRWARWSSEALARRRPRVLHQPHSAAPLEGRRARARHRRRRRRAARHRRRHGPRRPRRVPVRSRPRPGARRRVAVDGSSWPGAPAARSASTSTSPTRIRRCGARCSRLLDDAAADGLPMVAQVAGRSIGILYCLHGSVHPLLFHPAYAEVADLPMPERLVALADPERRRRLIEDVPDDGGLVPPGRARQARPHVAGRRRRHRLRASDRRVRRRRAPPRSGVPADAAGARPAHDRTTATACSTRRSSTTATATSR